MILSVPYAFNVHGYEGLRRNHSTFRKAGVLDVKIEEVPAETAVLAAEIQIESNRAGTRDKVWVPYRHVEGAGLYVPFNMQSLHTVPDTPVSTTDFAKIVADGDRSYLNPYKEYAEGASNPTDGKAQFNPKKRIWDDSEEIERAIQEIASDLVVVEGVVYTRLAPEEEPVFVAIPSEITDWHKGDHAFNWVKITESQYIDRPESTYRLDEWPVARDRIMASGYGNQTIAATHELPLVRVHQPAAFVRETEVAALANSLSQLLEKIRDFVNSRAKDRTTDPDRFQSNDGWRKRRIRHAIPREAALALVDLSEFLANDMDHARLTSCRPMLETIEKIDWTGFGPNDYAAGYVSEMARQAMADLVRYEERPARLRHENLDEDDLIALQGRI